MCYLFLFFVAFVLCIGCYQIGLSVNFTIPHFDTSIIILIVAVVIGAFVLAGLLGLFSLILRMGLLVLSVIRLLLLGPGKSILRLLSRIFGGALTKALPWLKKMLNGWSISLGRYKRAGGGGINVFRNGKRILGLDWHKFKLNGKMVNRPHYHRGSTKNQLRKHRPWEK